MSDTDISHPAVVSRAEWLKARLDLLQREKEMTYSRDRLNTARRELPMARMVKRVEKKLFVFKGLLPNRSKVRRIFVGGFFVNQSGS
jgi:predicted dithiol-disulfide oxidoreductase (DUF899 family)